MGEKSTTELSTSTMQLYFAKAEQLWATDNYNTDVSKLLFSPSLLTFFWKDNNNDFVGNPIYCFYCNYQISRPKSCFWLFLGNGTETIPKHQYTFEYKLKISISLGDIILNRNAEMCIIEREPIIYMFYVDR